MAYRSGIHMRDKKSKGGKRIRVKKREEKRGRQKIKKEWGKSGLLLQACHPRTQNDKAGIV